MPTREWNAATRSGIEVIGTRRAITAPIEPPIAMPSTTRNQARPSAGGWLASVVAIAIPMPIMPKKLPWRDVAGLDSPRSDIMNSTPATRYSTAARLAFISGSPLSSSPRGARRSLGLLLVHRQHALGDKEAAEDVYAGEDQRDETEAARPATAAGDHGNADREHRADHDHRRDRVGHRHQRRMQRGGHRPDHEVADEHGKHENRQPEHEGIDGLCNMIHGGSPKAVYLGWKFGWMTAPSLVSAVAFTSSSSQLTASALLGLSTMVSMKLNKLRAYRLEADCAMRPATMV